MVFCLIRFWSEIVEVLQERDIVQYSNACVHMSNWYGEKKYASQIQFTVCYDSMHCM